MINDIAEFVCADLKENDSNQNQENQVFGSQNEENKQ